MFSAARALSLSADAGKPLPHIDGLEDLYKVWTPREGQFIMIAGRSGTMKSAFAMYLTIKWNRPTLYVSGDMSHADTSMRLAQMHIERSAEYVREQMKDPERRVDLMRQMTDLQVAIVPESPITFPAIDEEILGWVELHNAYPEVIVLDNLMDFSRAEADYTVQMEVAQVVTSLTRHTGATVIILAHATDKSQSANGISWTRPPARNEIKNGMAEKPEVQMTVGVDLSCNRFQVAVTKQRSGKSDPGANEPISLRVEPEHLTFGKWSL